jgi:hypothetical protein
VWTAQQAADLLVVTHCLLLQVCPLDNPRRSGFQRPHSTDSKSWPEALLLLLLLLLQVWPLDSQILHCPRRSSIQGPHLSDRKKPH